MFVSQESRQKNQKATSKNDVLASEEFLPNIETSTSSATASTTTRMSAEARQKMKHNRRHKHGKKDAKNKNRDKEKDKDKDRKGYQASTAPEDFFKKTYESHFLEVVLIVLGLILT